MFVLSISTPSPLVVPIEQIIFSLQGCHQFPHWCPQWIERLSGAAEARRSTCTWVSARGSALQTCRWWLLKLDFGNESRWPLAQTCHPWALVPGEIPRGLLYYACKFDCENYKIGLICEAMEFIVCLGWIRLIWYDTMYLLEGLLIIK